MNNHHHPDYSPDGGEAYSQATTPNRDRDRLRIVGSDLPTSSSQTHSPSLAMLPPRPTPSGLAQTPRATYSNPRPQSISKYTPTRAEDELFRIRYESAMENSNSEDRFGRHEWDEEDAADNDDNDAKHSAADLGSSLVPKRGRPKGWRPGMTYREARGAPPLPPGASRPKTTTTTKPRPIGRPKGSGSGAGADGSLLPKRRGRPPRTHMSLAILRRKVYNAQRPKFLEFICEWQGCPARLHNADTLERHVQIVHGKRQETTGRGRVCMYGRCARQHDNDETHGLNNLQSGEHGIEPMTPSEPPETFATLDLLNEHMHDVHLDRVRRRMGDGPVVNMDRPGYAPADISRFLLDSRGRQVIPLLGRLEDLIEDEATRKMRKARLKRILHQRDDNAPVEAEYDGEEEDDEAEELAATLGGGMGLGG